MFESVTLSEFLLLALAASGIGFSKSGFSGVSMVHVLVFAFVFGAKDSTGILLPLLVVGDISATVFYGNKAKWSHVRRLLPPTLIGVVVGFLVMDRINESAFRPLVGTIIFVLTTIQIGRLWRPNSFEKLPHHPMFAWTLGLLAGFTTMLANAAGPVVALYLLAVALPKLELVGTSAWLFLIINVFKIPFSYQLGLIDAGSLALDAALSPAVVLGMFGGRWAVRRIPQTTFNILLLFFTAIAALRMVGLF